MDKIMITTIQRLNELKAILEENTTSEKFVSLTNPKNIVLMQSVTAWTCTNVKLREELVENDISIDELWQYCDFDTREFADTAGLELQPAIAKLRQMKNLKLIYPDGTANSKAISIIKLFVKNKIENL